MLTLEQFYHVLSAVFPLYVALVLGYGSLRWWNIVTADQGRGLNSFTSYIVFPALLFQIQALNDPYTMNWRLIVANSLAIFLILVMLCGWAWFTNDSIDWVITLLQLAVVPNNIIIGIPILMPLYTGATEGIATLFIGYVLSINVILILYETRKALLDISAKVKPFVSKGVKSVEGSTADAVVATAGRFSSEEAQFHNSCTLSHRTESSLPQIQGISGSADEGNCQMTIGSSEAEKDPNVFSETRAQASQLKKFRGTSVTDGEAHIQASEIDSALGRGREYPEVKTNFPKQVALKVMKKMMQLPVLYGSFLGITYSLIASRLGFAYPVILRNSVDIISRMGVGLCMYTIGLHMAGEKTLLSCGIWHTLVGSFWRFIIGPTAMGLTSLLIGLRGETLRFAIVQGALPQGLICFVLAKEYNLHANIFSTAVSFQTIVFLPILLAYYVMLELCK